MYTIREKEGRVSVRRCGLICRIFAAGAIFSAVMAATPVHPAETRDGAVIVRTVADALEHIQTLQCSFEKLYYRDTDKRTIVQKGTLAMKDPSFLRYQDATKLVVTDGKNVWMYVPANSQVQISTFLEGNETFPTPRSIFKQYTGTRKAVYKGEETIDGRAVDRLSLPAAKPDEAAVTVWIDRGYNFPVITLEEHPNGDTVKYILRDLTLNRPAADSLFVFKTPAGVEVLDMRE